MEKRTDMRAVFRTTAKITTDKKDIICEVEDLSLHGVYVRTDEHIESGKNMMIEILLSGTSSEVKLSVSGEVVRKEPHGFAIEFREIELDSYSILKNIVNYSPKK